MVGVTYNCCKTISEKVTVSQNPEGVLFSVCGNGFLGEFVDTSSLLSYGDLPRLMTKLKSDYDPPETLKAAGAELRVHFHFDYLYLRVGGADGITVCFDQQHRLELRELLMGMLRKRPPLACPRPAFGL